MTHEVDRRPSVGLHMPIQKGHCSISSGASSLMHKPLATRAKLILSSLHTMPQSGEEDRQEWQNSNKLYKEIRPHLWDWWEFTQAC